jgi:hypothetical protein
MLSRVGMEDEVILRGGKRGNVQEQDRGESAQKKEGYGFRGRTKVERTNDGSQILGL